MDMPKLTEEGLQAVRSVLIRDLTRGDPVEQMELRFEELNKENEIFLQWLQQTAISLERAAIELPEDAYIPEGIPVEDDRSVVSLLLAQNVVLTTGIQIYKAIKAALVSRDMDTLDLSVNGPWGDDQEE